MAELKTSVTVPDIQQVVQQVVAQFHPERIILFGSYAYGQPHEGSDLDLFVIVSNPPPHRENWKSAHELRQHSPLPLQVFFMSPEEFEETKEVVGGLAYPAHHWGKVLYEENS
ncbi:MAG: nucleotidyltransferase domain-containing protein [Candidatus Latescibacteria bacterium]|nr:nucleotidyltransferase domain-containing protein [Candidatus Latescibacterota bacterium]